ncbi:MAG: M20/M25/M40 family metallo-hydrolase [Bacteroidota bacterium]
MKRIILLLLTLPILVNAQHADKIKAIYDEALSNGRVYEDLRGLCKDVGHRLSGSPGAAAAVEYTRYLMQSYDFDTVYLQPVMVPHWVRGKKEVVRAINSEKYGTFDLHALAIGNSVGTGPDGILAEVIEVNGMGDLENLKKAKDKIVFYNGVMDPTIINGFAAYGQAVRQRGGGASEAAKYGARAVLIRSVTNRRDDIPHTGALRYDESVKKIPAIAISTNDADKLSKILKEQAVKVYIETHCQRFEDVLSYNVIGEIRGSVYPDEFIAVGGHLDSWDVGEGAHDDGSGCVQGIEALRLFKALNITPKRTLRAVMWMNEENGGRGGSEYARVAKEKGENHIAALESDNGGFQPLGFTMTGTDTQKEQVRSWRKYFTPYRVWDFEQDGGGADINPLKVQGTLLLGLRPNTQRYFEFHHTPADVFEVVDKRELELGAASLSAMIYLLDQEGVQ